MLNFHVLPFPILSGNIELKNLLIRENVFEKLKLPFTVIYGELGLLQIKVNWTGLLSKPLKVTISDGQPANSKKKGKGERAVMEELGWQKGRFLVNIIRFARI
jgi:hypothetical protein